MTRSTNIAQTLVQTGGADVNAYNSEGSTLLIDAIKRSDGFSAKFLLEKNCNVNLTSKSTADTALHLVSTYDEKSTDPETFNEMLDVAKKLVEQNADVNIQNLKGL